MKTSLDQSFKSYARMAGLLYIVIIGCGMWSAVFVREVLIVPDDAAITAQNIVNAPNIFRLGFVADLFMVMSDVVVAIVFFLLFSAVNKEMSLLATAFRLVQVTIIGISLLHYSIPLLLLEKSIYLSTMGADQLNAQILVSIDAYNYGYLISNVFFGVNCLLMGLLIKRSGFFPPYLSVMLVFASFGYLLNSFTNFLAPEYGDLAEGILILTALPSELALCFWLIKRGFSRKPNL